MDEPDTGSALAEPMEGSGAGAGKGASTLRSKAKRELLRRLVGYIRNNRERIDYARYRELGIPLGSGRVEGACRHLVGKRCKGSGTRNWKPSRCGSILALRAGVYERRFYRLWEEHIRPAAWRYRKSAAPRGGSVWRGEAGVVS